MKEQSGDMEQFLISASVVRQADKLPPDLVELNKQRLAVFGIVRQALQTLLALPKEAWLQLIDKQTRG